MLLFLFLAFLRIFSGFRPHTASTDSDCPCFRPQRELCEGGSPKKAGGRAEGKSRKGAGRRQGQSGGRVWMDWRMERASVTVGTDSTRKERLPLTSRRRVRVGSS